jgi:hypothetical protein
MRRARERKAAKRQAPSPTQTTQWIPTAQMLALSREGAESVAAAVRIATTSACVKSVLESTARIAVAHSASQPLVLPAGIARPREPCRRQRLFRTTQVLLSTTGTSTFRPVATGPAANSADDMACPRPLR